MGLRFLFILALLVNYVFISAQVPPKSKNDFKKISTKKNTLHQDLQYLMKENEFDIENPTHRSLSHDFLCSILYYDISLYSKEIQIIINENKSHNISDSTYIVEVLRYDALLAFQQKKYNESIKKFRVFFKTYQSYYKNDTSYATEYNRYVDANKKVFPINTFYSLIDSAIMIAKKKKNPENDLALAYQSIGRFYVFERRLDTARYLLLKARSLINKSTIKDIQTEVKIYSMFGYLELFNRNMGLSLNYFNKSIDLLLSIPHSDLQLAYLYYNTAGAYQFSNRQTDAKKRYKMALHIYNDFIPLNHPSVILTYRMLSMSCMSLNDYEDAIYYGKKTIELNAKDDIYDIRNLADIYAKVDSLELADNLYKKSLTLCIAQSEYNDYQTGYTKYRYGEFLLEKLHNYPMGEKLLSESIVNFYNIYGSRHIDIVDLLNILGTHYINTNRIDRGLDTLQSALNNAIDNFHEKSIYQNPNIKTSIRNSSFHNTLAWKAYGLYLKYLKSNDIKDLKMSFKTYDDFIYLSKEIRKYYKDTESRVLGSQLDYVYGQAVDIGIQLYNMTHDSIYKEKIFEFIEGKKSYTLLSSLSILESKRLLKIPEKLLKKENDLKNQLGIINEKINAETMGINNKNKIRELDSIAFSLSMSLDTIQEIYKDKYSGFYNLKYGFKELLLSDIEASLPKNKAFLNYALSDSLLTTLCITSEGTEIYTERIDSSFYSNVETLVELLSDFNTDNSNIEFQHFLQASRKLYKHLIEPSEKSIYGKDLIIIPDDILNYISFDALLTEDVNIDRPDYRNLPYLINEYKSNIANSIQIYYNMKSRVRESQNKVYAFAPEYQSSFDTTGLPDSYHYLRPLEYSADEINTIPQFLPANLYCGLDATEDTFFSVAKDAKILHLAMHTIINDADPLYSKLLFTYDNENNSGLVNTYELLTLNLNAELAVLSGCSTGDGELQKGEGVMSLSSGFQYAGVPSIIMSLWEVNDRFGSLVIDRFYKNIANGFTKSKALHQAKLNVLSQGNALYSHPFYWSGLTLMGDDSQINFNNGLNIKQILAVILLLLIAVFIIYKFI